MRGTESCPHTRRFGVFEVDLRAAELRKRGRRIKLQEQPFQILSLLLEHPGEVVTREELRQKLWPAHTFVDFDRSLNKAMTKLRAALGDSADSPRYIETIPRHGYRFLAPVHVHYQEPLATMLACGQHEEAPQKPESNVAEPRGIAPHPSKFSVFALNVHTRKGRLRLLGLAVAASAA